jgi:ParB family chromosome partitioning protein
MERMYISGIVHLVEHQEVALIEAVEAGRLPISVAVQIANGKDAEVSEALSQAYETGQLRGTKLAAARRLIAKRVEKRQKDGKRKKFAAKSPETCWSRCINSGFASKRPLSQRRN